MEFKGANILKLWRLWQNAKADAEWHRQALERQGKQLTAAHKRIAELKADINLMERCK
jgi:hypothetical protein